MILHHWKYHAEWCSWCTFLSWAEEFGMDFWSSWIICYFQILTVPSGSSFFFSKEAGYNLELTNLSENFQLESEVSINDSISFCIWS